MAERISKRQVKDSSYSNSLMKILAKWFSGADPEIIDRMPSSDTFNYGYMGFFNLLISIFLAYSFNTISKIIFENSSITNIILSLLIFLASILLLRQSGKRIINTHSFWARVLLISFIFSTGIFTGFGFLISNTEAERKKRDTDIGKTYQTLQSYRAGVYKPLEAGFKSGLDYTYLNLIKNTTSYNDSFVVLAKSKIGDFSSSPDTILIQRLNDLTPTYSVYNGDYGKIDTIAISKVLDRYAGSSLFLMDSILPFFKSNEPYVSLSPSKKLAVQYEFITLGIILRSAPYALSILLFLPFLLMTTGRFSRKDFYHKLLSEKEKSNEESLKREREKVTKDFRIQVELKNTKTGLEKLGQNDDEFQKIAKELNVNLSVDNLEKAAQIQYEYHSYDKALEFINKAIELQDEEADYDPEKELRPELYEFKARILTELKDPERAKKMLDRFVELNDEKKYRSNLKREILLDRLELKNLPFFGDLKWNFADKVNILLGKNGYGKSHLLGLIIAMLYDDKIKSREWISPTTTSEAKAKLYIKSNHPVNNGLVEELLKKLKDNQKKLDDDLVNKKLTTPQINDIRTQINTILENIDTEQRRILASKEGITGTIGRVPILAIPDSRFIDKSEQGFGNDTSISDDLRKDGATEFLYAKSFARIIKKGLFITAQQNSTDFKKPPYNLIERVISELAGTKGDTAFFRFERVETINTTGDYKFYVKSEDNNVEFPLQQVSQGTFSVLAMFLMIYRFLSELKTGSKDIYKEKAIVFIDEIDAHLHPSWEQKIISILRREFPNVQFIITAHSPLIVAGCSEGEASVMRHETSKGFTLEQPSGDFIGYATEELFRKIFEVEDKDQKYIEFTDMIKEERKYQTELENLKKKKNSGTHFATKDEERMNDLTEILNNINLAKKRQKERVEPDVLRSKNKELQSRVNYLEGQITEITQKIKETKIP